MFVTRAMAIYRMLHAHSDMCTIAHPQTASEMASMSMSGDIRSLTTSGEFGVVDARTSAGGLGPTSAGSGGGAAVAGTSSGGASGAATTVGGADPLVGPSGLRRKPSRVGLSSGGAGSGGGALPPLQGTSGEGADAVQSMEPVMQAGTSRRGADIKASGQGVESAEAGRAATSSSRGATQLGDAVNRPGAAAGSASQPVKVHTKPVVDDDLEEELLD